MRRQEHPFRALKMRVPMFTQRGVASVTQSDSLRSSAEDCRCSKAKTQQQNVSRKLRRGGGQRQRKEPRSVDALQCLQVTDGSPRAVRHLPPCLEERLPAPARCLVPGWPLPLLPRSEGGEAQGPPRPARRICTGGNAWPAVLQDTWIDACLQGCWVHFHSRESCWVLWAVPLGRAADTGIPPPAPLPTQ